jgi:3-hydroxyisobutyrate dehydrogenase-like beta-hydroxyacid dehydrogenase
MSGNAGLGEKDLKCAIESAQASGIELPLTRLSQNLIKGVFLNETNYKDGVSNDT